MSWCCVSGMRELTRTILLLMRQKLEDEQVQVRSEETFR